MLTEQAVIVDIPGLLEPGAATPLGAWYAEPLAPAAADAVLTRLHRARQRGGSPGPFAWGLAELAARHWRGHDPRGAHEVLAATAADAVQAALADLVCGQLLMARKRRGARDYLRRGFSRAATLLPAADYFRVLRRHELLGHLVLGDTPAPPRGLIDLLAEAAVIRRLQGADHPPRRGAPSRHRDTVG